MEYLIFHSQGYHKNFETNIIEAVIINDFTFTSNDFVNSRGFISNYTLLLKIRIIILKIPMLLMKIKIMIYSQL